MTGLTTSTLFAVQKMRANEQRAPRDRDAGRDKRHIVRENDAHRESDDSWKRPVKYLGLSVHAVAGNERQDREQRQNREQDFVQDDVSMTVIMFGDKIGKRRKCDQKNGSRKTVNEASDRKAKPQTVGPHLKRARRGLDQA